MVVLGWGAVSYERDSPVMSSTVYAKRNLCEKPWMEPRQSVGGGKSIQKRVRKRFSLLETTALRGKLTFGDPFEDSGVDLCTEP